jgi:hypothetical protein
MSVDIQRNSSAGCETSETAVRRMISSRSRARSRRQSRRRQEYLHSPSTCRQGYLPHERTENSLATHPLVVAVKDSRGARTIVGLRILFHSARSEDFLYAVGNGGQCATAAAALLASAITAEGAGAVIGDSS